MTDFTINLTPNQLADLFPFHLAINPEWKVTQMGRVIQRICPHIHLGDPFEQHFQICRPITPLSFKAIQAHLQSLFVVQIQASALPLKGQMIEVKDPEGLLFLGSPWIANLESLTGFELALSDFAIHDPTSDYLVVLQAQTAALTEARQLAHTLKQQQADVNMALQQEKDLNDLKSRFITTASHEFRTPLGIIASSAGIMQDYAFRLDEAMRQKHLSRIQAAVSRMAGLLDDVLTMSQVEAGMLKFDPQPLNLVAFFQDMVKTFQVHHLHHLNCTIAPDLVGQTVTLDHNRLNQLLLNLLSNAVKYTPGTGSITLELKCQENQIVFVLQDSGIGIPPEDLSSIFHPFHRASNVGTISGTGLGLAIAKHCVDLHNGKIEIVSEVGVGTTITVSLPFQRAPNADKCREASVMN